MTTDYAWGIDGYGRAHICIDSENVILFSGFKGVCGKVLLDYYLTMLDFGDLGATIDPHTAKQPRQESSRERHDPRTDERMP